MQVEYDTIRVETDPRGVATLSLARPEKHNAMSAQMLVELTEAVGQLGNDPAVRVVVLTGIGASFCAGGDLDWMRQQMAADAPTRAREAMKLATMLQALNTCPKPVIGRVQGNAFGGGIGLISVCDVAIASDGAKFGLTETRLGLIPATIGPYVAAQMGEAKARRVFMSARIFEAQEAVVLDLLARAVPEADLDAAVEAEVKPYLAAAPGAVAEAKALLRRLGPVIDEAAIADTIAALTRRWESAEAVEGIAAFFEKRKARWGEVPKS
ncbi:methylglutaconyl-CoA hydratase [Aliiruegeria lutimaris]|uniref:Methylglutaconyl-CoA hydratase n=2 Tax=Aliiruegeria lutimaris TaxID=571298 RepID=A0A1G8J6Q4_9RHOB|nr:methylglutaconyl-CoA hydratase [Aliiruegeria lutimaris]